MSKNKVEEPVEVQPEEEEEEPEPQNLINPEQVETIWNAEDPLNELFQLYTTFFNPEHDDEYDVVDDNKIKFIAEFQIYNLIFCKNDLHLDNKQTSEVLEMLWNLLAINQDGTIQDHSLPAEQGFQEAMNSKFEELKNELIEKAKSGILSKENIKAIMLNMKTGYFKHFRLIDFVIRNKQYPTFKKIRLFYDKPLTSGNLDGANEIIEEPSVSPEDELAQKEGEEEDIDPNKDPLEGLDERLDKVNLEDEEKTQVKQQLEEYNKEANEKVEEKKKKLAAK